MGGHRLVYPHYIRAILGHMSIGQVSVVNAVAAGVTQEGEVADSIYDAQQRAL